MAFKILISKIADKFWEMKKITARLFFNHNTKNISVLFPFKIKSKRIPLTSWILYLVGLFFRKKY